MEAGAPELAHLPSVPVAVVRRRVQPSDLSRVVPECCGQVWNAMRGRPGKPGRHVAIYWNGEIRLEVGVEFADPFESHGEVVRSATPEGWTAFATHLGPYAELGRTHQAIQRWCKANGHHLAGPNWEIYGHWQAAWDTSPSEIRTDVYYQVMHA